MTKKLGSKSDDLIIGQTLILQILKQSSRENFQRPRVNFPCKQRSIVGRGVDRYVHVACVFNSRAGIRRLKSPRFRSYRHVQSVHFRFQCEQDYAVSAY